MKKCTIIALVLCILLGCSCSFAEDVRYAETPLFSISLPKGWVIDEVRDATAINFGALAAFSRPCLYTVYMDYGDYSCHLNVYQLRTQDKAYINQYSDKASACFRVMNQFTGMTKYESQMNPQPVRFDTDTRTFIASEVKGEKYFMASYYNQQAGLGYSFYFSGSFVDDYDSKTAEALLYECLLALKEPGVNTTIDPNSSRVVITGDSAKVRGEASLSGRLIKTVYKGESFVYLGTDGDFLMILVDGQTGYVHKGVCTIK